MGQHNVRSRVKDSNYLKELFRILGGTERKKLTNDGQNKLSELTIRHPVKKHIAIKLYEGYHLKHFADEHFPNKTRLGKDNPRDKFISKFGHKSIYNGFGSEIYIDDDKPKLLFDCIAQLSDLSEAECFLQFLLFCQEKSLPLRIFNNDTERDDYIEDLHQHIKNCLEDTMSSNPYKGLEPFTAADSELFFGRHELIQSICQALYSQPIVGLIGASGVGKSSLMNAGVAAQLERNDCLFIEFRPSDRISNDPFFALACSLVCHYSKTEGLADLAIEQEKTAAALKNGDLSLVTCVDLIREETSQKIVIYIDQFEELFTLHLPDQDIESFINMLVSFYHATSLDESVAASISFSIRADFIEYINAYRQFTDLLTTKNTINIFPPGKEDLRCAIEEPARLSNVRFDDGLVDLILEHSCSSKSALPLVSFLLKELWETQDSGTIRLLEYHRLGGITGSLIQRTEEKFSALSEIEQRQAGRIITALVDTNKDNIDTKRIAKQNEFEQDEWLLIQKLADAKHRLLTIDNNQEYAASSPTVELVHETLITQWDRLHEWLDIHRTCRIWQNELTIRMANWLENQNDTENLLKGDALAQARQNYKKYTGMLRANEKNFIEASIKEYDAALSLQRKKDAKSKILQRTLVISSTCIAAIFIGLSLFLKLALRDANIQKQSAIEAQKKAQINLKRLIIEKAERQLDQKDTRLAVLLALKLLPESGVIDESILKVGSSQRALNILKQAEGKYLETMRIDVEMEILDFDSTSDAQRLVVVTEKGVISLWEIEPKKKLFEVRSQLSDISSIKFTADDTKIMTIGAGLGIEIRNAVDGKYLTSVDGDFYDNAELTSNGNILVTRSKDSTVELHEIFKPSVEATLQNRILRSWKNNKFRFNTDNSTLWLISSGVIHEISVGKSGYKFKNKWDVTQYSEVHISPNGRFLFVNSGKGRGSLKAGRLSTFEQFIELDLEYLLVEKPRSELNVDRTVIFDEVRNTVTVGGVFDFRVGNERMSSFKFDLLNGKVISSSKVQSYNFDRSRLSYDTSKILFDPPFANYAFLHNFDSEDEIAVIKRDTWKPKIANEFFLIPHVKFLGKTTSILNKDPPNLKSISIWKKIQLPQRKFVQQNSASNIHCINFNALATLIVSCDGNTALVRSIPTGNILKVLRGHQGQVKYAAFNYDSSKILTVSEDRTIRVWSLSTGAELFKVTEKGFVKKALFSNDEKSILSISVPKYGEILVSEYPIKKHHSDNLRFGKNFRLKTGIADGKIDNQLTNEAVSSITPRFSTFLKQVHSVFESYLEYGTTFGTMLHENIISFDGQLVIQASLYGKELTGYFGFVKNNRLLIKNRIENVVQQEILLDTAPIRFIGFAPNSQIVFVIYENKAQYWNVETGKQVSSIEIKDFHVKSYLHSVDNNYFVAFNDDQIKIWNIHSGKIVFSHTAIVSPIKNLSISLDSNLLAWSEGNGRIITTLIESITDEGLINYYRDLGIPALTTREQQELLLLEVEH